jgi:hypothetical protein
MTNIPKNLKKTHLRIYLKNISAIIYCYTLSGLILCIVIVSVSKAIQKLVFSFKFFTGLLQASPSQWRCTKLYHAEYKIMAEHGYSSLNACFPDYLHSF